MELAHLRRNKYGKKNELLSSVQTSLFEESALAVIVAIHAEIEQIDATAKHAWPNHRVPAPAICCFRIIRRALNTK